MKKIFLIFMVLAMILFAGGFAFSQEVNTGNEVVAAFAALTEPGTAVEVSIFKAETGSLIKMINAAPGMFIMTAILLLLITVITVSQKIRNKLFEYDGPGYRIRQSGGAAERLIFPTV